MREPLTYRSQKQFIYSTQGLGESIDIMGLLHGRYEAERLPKDFSPERIVPDFAFNVLNPLGLLYRPVADEAYLENGGEKPRWPEGKPFAVCLTHDVDLVYLYSLKAAFRQHFCNLKNIRGKRERIRSKCEKEKKSYKLDLRVVSLKDVKPYYNLNKTTFLEFMLVNYLYLVSFLKTVVQYVI